MPRTVNVGVVTNLTNLVWEVLAIDNSWKVDNSSVEDLVLDVDIDMIALLCVTTGVFSLKKSRVVIVIVDDSGMEVTPVVVTNLTNRV